jgi:hypothetical protein
VLSFWVYIVLSFILSKTLKIDDAPLEKESVKEKEEFLIG